jgi:uncharacterized protein YraI
MTLKTLILTAGLALVGVTTTHAKDYMIAYGVSQGEMNMRTGPSTRFPLVAGIPSGERVTASQCSDRWCYARWNGFQGWVAQSGLIADPDDDRNLEVKQCMDDIEARLRNAPAYVDYDKAVAREQKKCLDQ